MRTISPANLSALVAARDRGLVVRQFFWIVVRDRDTGAPQGVGLWTGDYTITPPVLARDGTTVSRPYIGGVNLAIPEIPRVSDYTQQTIEVSFSAIAPVCQTIVRGFEPRLATVDIHVGLFDPSTRQLVDTAMIDFFGVVYEAPIDTAAPGQESRITLSVVSDAFAMLTRTNPRKRSYEAQKRRDGDEFHLYSNAVQTWRIHWGEREVNADGSGSGGFGQKPIGGGSF